MKTLLEFLKQDGRMVFPSGYYLQGDSENNYIDCGSDIGGKDGVWQLTEEGLQSALSDAKKYDEENKHQ